VQRPQAASVLWQTTPQKSEQSIWISAFPHGAEELVLIRLKLCLTFPNRARGTGALQHRGPLLLLLIQADLAHILHHVHACDAALAAEALRPRLSIGFARAQAATCSTARSAAC